MKRFVLSLVTALSLMGAAQAFALPVPTVEHIKFRNYSAGVDSQFASFGGVSKTLFYSAPIATANLHDPSSSLKSGYDGSAVAGPDSVAFAIFRIVPLSGSAVTVAADSVYFHIQVSANGTEWITWAPTSTANRASTTLGTNAGVTLLEAGTTNAFWYALRIDPKLSGYPFNPTSQTGTTAAGVTDVSGWLNFPLIRVALEGFDLAGQYRIEMRYWREKNAVSRLMDDFIPWRTNGTAFAQGYSDSMYASNGPGTSTTVLTAVTDTTSWIAMDKWVLPQGSPGPGFLGSGGGDTLSYASAIFHGSYDNGTSPTGMDTLFVTPQLNLGDGVIISLPQHRIIGAAGTSAFLVPLKVGLLTAATTFPAGTFVPAPSGSTVLLNRIFGLAPSIRFITVRDAVGSGAIRLRMRHYEAVEANAD